METVTSPAFVLVTGGSGGIGSALCRLLPTIGITPIVGFNANSNKAQLLANELGGFAVNINMNEIKSIEKAIHCISKHIQSPNSFLGVVIGASPPPEIEPLRKITSSHLLNQFQVNVIGPHLLINGLINSFFHRRRSGIIIGILSKAIGDDNQPVATQMGAYVIAKTGLKSLLEIYAAECPWLTVKTITPSYTKTRMLDVFDPRYVELLQEKNKISTPEEIAQQIIEKLKQ